MLLNNNSKKLIIFLILGMGTILNLANNGNSYTTLLIPSGQPLGGWHEAVNKPWIQFCNGEPDYKASLLKLEEIRAQEMLTYQMTIDQKTTEIKNLNCYVDLLEKTKANNEDTIRILIDKLPNYNDNPKRSNVQLIADSACESDENSDSFDHSMFKKKKLTDNKKKSVTNKQKLVTHGKKSSELKDTYRSKAGDSQNKTKHSKRRESSSQYDSDDTDISGPSKKKPKKTSKKYSQKRRSPTGDKNKRKRTLSAEDDSDDKPSKKGKKVVILESHSDKETEDPAVSIYMNQHIY
jgi:hypothetical protein